jgi:hypothetical protein
VTDRIPFKRALGKGKEKHVGDMIWTICFADREYAREHGDPDLGQVEAATREEALQKARNDPGIVRRTFGHCAGLWAYRAKEQASGRNR